MDDSERPDLDAPADAQTCTRCGATTVVAATQVDHEADRLITTRTLECPRCGYRRTWVTVAIDAA